LWRNCREVGAGTTIELDLTAKPIVHDAIAARRIFAIHNLARLAHQLFRGTKPVVSR
jgi:hypothetical protein